MLDPPKRRNLDRSVTVSLEQLVLRDHFYRHLDAALDLTFVRDWVAERYADRGRSSIDPVVFFKFYLIMFFAGIRSERKLVELANLNVAHRWFLGYHFDERLPDRVVSAKFCRFLRIDRRHPFGAFEVASPYDAIRPRAMNTAGIPTVAQG